MTTREKGELYAIGRRQARNENCMVYVGWQHVRTENYTLKDDDKWERRTKRYRMTADEKLKLYTLSRMTTSEEGKLYVIK
jgi:hypothetical protein